MKKQIIATLLGFIANFIVNSIIAMAILGPLLNSSIGIVRDAEKDGLNFPAILSGYLLLTIFMVWLTQNIKGKTWLQKGIIVGLMTGLAVNIAGHLIIAGWSVAGGMGMFLSGIIDTLATVVGALVISFILRNNETK